ncbi:MAG: hypothetical protein JO194_01355 [Candidatus Eremiobacteraeota bacterium]|nr:hypothetical protein [Candidatus Eremiobacteraeota bacterium]
MRPFAFLFTLLCVTSSQPLAAATIAAPPLPAGAIVITSAPNGDLLGYRIVIMPDGSAASEDGAGKGQLTIAQPVLKLFLDDLESAMPLSQLPNGACPAGQTAAPNPVMVTYHAQTSPDISCARDAHETALYRDVLTIARSMYVANYRSRAVTFHGNGNSTDASVPAPPPPAAPSMPSGGYGGHGYM